MEHKKRCTFAIISHPDAGKTTMTEKLLWFGRVVRQVGMVKSKQGNYAKSDWMELEKERGISVSSSVISFPYNDREIHLLDTPGHQDFSEDTYRTLTAVESVLMMIDSAKGVESQTVKLMEVCRMRDTPIVTYMNKLDRESLTPFELLENIEEILSIQCAPMTWPVGSGVDFKGVYDIYRKQIIVYENDSSPESPLVIDAADLQSKKILELIGEDLQKSLIEEIEVVSELLPALNKDEFLAGIQTPVFFGSALHNFGIKETLEFIESNGPGPAPREVIKFPFDDEAERRMILPSEKKFTGFIFKIQANMDKKHRDRIAFLRVCSGVFKRNNKIFHTRTGKDIKISSPLIFQARDRDIVEEAFPGDIIGLHDSGKYQIGDTFSEGEKIKFTGIPSFSPEIFAKIILKDPLKAKQLEKGLIQLSEEGTVQLFTRHTTREKILGAVGQLQFEVVKFRLEDEYKVNGIYESYPFIGVRWPKFTDDNDKDSFIESNANSISYDVKNRVCFSYRSEWDLKLIQDKNPNITFHKNSDYS